MTKHAKPSAGIQFIRKILHEMSINHLVAISGGEYRLKFNHPTSGATTSLSFELGSPDGAKGTLDGPHFIVSERQPGSDETKIMRFTAILPLLKHLDVSPEIIDDLRRKSDAKRLATVANDVVPPTPRMGM